MKRWFVAAVTLLTGTVVTILAVGCAPDTSAPVLIAGNRPTNTEPLILVQDPLQPTPYLEPFTDTACLNCHTDQDRLTELAVVKEKAESLSSGPG